MKSDTKTIADCRRWRPKDDTTCARVVNEQLVIAEYAAVP